MLYVMHRKATDVVTVIKRDTGRVSVNYTENFAKQRKEAGRRA